MSTANPSNEVLHATLAIDNISVTLVNVITPTFQDSATSGTATAPPQQRPSTFVRQRCPLTHISVCFERVGKKGSRRSTRWASTLYPQVGDDLDESAPQIAASKDRVLYFGTMSTMYFPIQVKAESQAALNAAYVAASRERGRTNHSLARLNSSLMTSAPSTFNATASTAAGGELLSVASKSKHPLVCTIRCFDVEKAKLDFEAAESSYFQPRKPFYNAKVSELTTGIEVDIAACINNALLQKKRHDECAGEEDAYDNSGNKSSSPTSASSDRYVVNSDGSITYTVNIVFAPSALVTISNSSIHGPITIRLQFTARCEQLATDDDVTKEAASVEAIIKKIKKMAVSSMMGGSSTNNNNASTTSEFTQSQLVAAKQLEDVLHDGDTGADEEPLTGLKGANPPTLFSLRMYNSRRHATIALEKENVGGRGGGRSSVGGQSSDVVFPHYEEPVNLLDPTNGTRCIATNESFMTAANTSSVSTSVAASMEHFRGNLQDAFAEAIPGGTDSIDNNNHAEDEYVADGNSGNYENKSSSLTGLVQYIHPSTMARAAASASSSSSSSSPSTPTPLVPSFSRNRHNAHSYHDYCIVMDSILLNTSMVSTTTTSVPSHAGGGGALGRVNSYGMGFFADTTSGTPANHPSFVCPKLLEPDSRGIMCFAPAEGTSIVSFHDEVARTSSSPNTPTDEPLKSPASTADDDINNHKSWCIFSCRSASYSNMAVGRREIVTSRFKTVGDGDEDCVSPIPTSTLLAKSVAPTPSTPNRVAGRGGGGGGSKPLLHTPAISAPTTISNAPEKGLCKSSQRAKLVFCLVRVSRDEGGVLRPCSEAASFQALDLAAEVLNVENYPHDGETFRVRFNYGEMLQFRLRRRCFRAPLVHLSALLMPPPPLPKPKDAGVIRSPSRMSPNFASPASRDNIGGSSTSTANSPTGQGGDKKLVSNNNDSAVAAAVHLNSVNKKEVEEEDANVPNANTQSLPTSNTRLYSPQAQ